MINVNNGEEEAEENLYSVIPQTLWSAKFFATAK
jgi:hypothetical protein